jgi:hypothetical protein
MEKKSPLPIGLTMKTPPPETVDAGAEFSFPVTATWPEAVRRENATYLVREGESIIHSGPLPEAGADGEIEFKLRAPEQVGQHALTLEVAYEHEGGGMKGALPFVITSVPHETSLAAWDTPSPVVRGTSFALKAGAKCTSSCPLSGRTVEIRDEKGKLVASGALGDAAWEGTTALYWTTLSAKAPKKLGLHAWQVGFSGAELKLPHGAATARFSFVVVPEPEHSVRVMVIDKATKAPVKGAQVRLGLYRAVTGENGAVRLEVPKGEFPLVVTRAGYEMPESRVAVSKDVRVKVAAEALPEENPFAMWTA